MEVWINVLSNLLGLMRRRPKGIPSSALTLVRYIHLDVVGFAHERSVEAQADIISALNGIVRHVVASRVPRNSAIYTPIGDGICVALSGKGVDYESHICIALGILAQIHKHNKNVERMRQFEVRIGINQNDDNIVTDINGKRNVIGAGVNFAQRIMSYADGGQILVGQSVYHSLNYREKYMGKFRKYSARVKHNIPLDLIQYTDERITELKSEIPSAFATKEEPRLSKVAAYYFAHCLKNRRFILETRGPGQRDHASRLLLWYLAKDSLGESESNFAKPYEPQILETKRGTLNEQLEEYMKLPFSVCCDHGYLALDRDLGPGYFKHFDDGSDGLIVNMSGQNKLKSEWPGIWDQFDLENIDFRE